MTKGEALELALEKLRNAIPELQGLLLASNEGLPIAHTMKKGSDPNRVAAMAAAAFSLGSRITASTTSGAMGEFWIQAEGGSMFIYPAGSQAVLAVIGLSDSNVGLISLEARTAAIEIGTLLDKVTSTNQSEFSVQIPFPAQVAAPVDRSEVLAAA